MDRRYFLHSSAMGALVGATGLGALKAQAAAPFATEQAASFYRLNLGAYQITAFSDGTLQAPLDQLHLNTTPEAVTAALADAFLAPTIDLSINAFAVNTGDRLVLIDTGASDLLGPGLGRLPAAMAAAGLAAEQVDAVILTHVHPDHFGGLLLNGERVFKDAQVLANQRDIDFWLDPASREAAPEATRVFYDQAVAALTPYREAGQLAGFEDDADPLPGFKSVWRPGHTPGHSSITVESEGETFVAWGDITHGDVVQFDEPGVSMAFDVDPDQAAETRARAFADAAQQRYLVAGAHTSFPGLGHVRKDDSNYDWTPVNYSAL